MQTFAKLALAAGVCALGLGAALPVQAADMGYPEAQAGYPAPPPGYYAPPPAQQGYYPPPPPAAYGYPPPPPVEYGTYAAAALRRRAGAVLRAVLARRRTALCLCLWLRALARLSALVKSTRRRMGRAKRNPPWARRASDRFRCALPILQKNIRRFRNLGCVCEFLWLPVRFLVGSKEHGACFTASISR